MLLTSMLVSSPHLVITSSCHLVVLVPNCILRRLCEYVVVKYYNEYGLSHNPFSLNLTHNANVNTPVSTEEEGEASEQDTFSKKKGSPKKKKETKKKEKGKEGKTAKAKKRKKIVSLFNIPTFFVGLLKKAHFEFHKCLPYLVFRGLFSISLCFSFLP